MLSNLNKFFNSFKNLKHSKLDESTTWGLENNTDSLEFNIQMRFNHDRKSKLAAETSHLSFAIGRVPRRPQLFKMKMTSVASTKK